MIYHKVLVLSLTATHIYLKLRVYSPVAASRGSKTITVSQLNMSCTVAPANALRNSALSFDCANDTNVLVTDVPMLAPIIIGMAVGTSRTKNKETTTCQTIRPYVVSLTCSVNQRWFGHYEQLTYPGCPLLFWDLLMMLRLSTKAAGALLFRGRRI